MTLPDSVSFDAVTLVKMHTARRRRLLEVTLAKFTVLVPMIAIYQYLVSKAYLKKNVEMEIKTLRDIYTVTPIDDNVIVNAAKIEAKLLRKGIRMDKIDMLTGISAITNHTLLVSADPERYRPLSEFGLDVMDLEKFLREVERIIDEELRE